MNSIVTLVKQFRNLRCTCALLNSTPSLVNEQKRFRSDGIRELRTSKPKVDFGTTGETSMDIDVFHKTSEQGLYPTADTPASLFDGVRFDRLPIANIKTTKNNTIIGITDYNGDTIVINSCGREGFKNTRKGTNIAAQATAITLAGKAIHKGVSSVRVVVRGVGPGRMSSVKGLQMGGLNVVSVTDGTQILFNPLRPRKARRI